MIEKIFVGIICVAILAAGVWVWRLENGNSADEEGEEDKGK